MIKTQILPPQNFNIEYTLDIEGRNFDIEGRNKLGYRSLSISKNINFEGQ